MKELKKMKLEEIAQMQGFTVKQGDGELRYSKFFPNGQRVSFVKAKSRQTGKMEWSFHVTGLRICEVLLTKAQVKTLLIKYLLNELEAGE